MRGSTTVHFGRKTMSESWASKEVQLPDQAQGFLLLRRANLSTHERIAIMTLAGNSLSLGGEEGVEAIR